MKIYCILREKIWNLNFNKLWKPRSIFFCGLWALLSITFAKTAFSCPADRSIEGKNREKNWESKNFSQTSSKFFENVFRTALNMSGEAFWADFFLQNFNFTAILRSVFPQCCQKSNRPVQKKNYGKLNLKKDQRLNSFFLTLTKMCRQAS